MGRTPADLFSAEIKYLSRERLSSSESRRRINHTRVMGLDRVDRRLLTPNPKLTMRGQVQEVVRVQRPAPRGEPACFPDSVKGRGTREQAAAERAWLSRLTRTAFTLPALIPLSAFPCQDW
ncbi:MAG: hypothetical protein ACREUU_12345, partial [Gammaproteobacteria bacterium]